MRQRDIRNINTINYKQTVKHNVNVLGTRAIIIVG